MADWWQGGGESGGPTAGDLRAAGWFYRTDTESWEPPPGWVKNPLATMGYAPAPFVPPKVQWRSTAEQLQSLTGQAPVSVPRYVETGEGGYTAYDYYDPASQAKQLLAQPEKVTPEYIAQNFPGFGRLPASTLQAMANDWRNAYAQLMKIATPEKLPEGYTQAVSRVEGGKPFISFGGPTEIFEEAAPYVQYVPEYGLVVPQQGIQPYREKFGLMNLVPGIFGGLVLGPLGTALGGGVLGAAGAGALTGGITSAITGGDVLKGALTGGITGGVGAAATPIVGEALKSAGITGAAADVIRNAAVSAGTAALRGGDPLQAALSAAVGTGVGSAVSSTLGDIDPMIAKALTAAASGAAKAAITGADPIQSALLSVADVGLKTALSGITQPGQAAQALTPSQRITDTGEQTGLLETPTESWIDRGMLMADSGQGMQDILDMLAAQQAEQGAMEQSLAGYVPPDGMEQSIMRALSQQQAESDDAIAALEAALGQPISASTEDIMARLAAQEEDQAAMETAMRGYDQRIVELMQQGESEQEAMRKALEDIGITQQEQQKASGQQISGLGKVLGSALTGLAGKFGQTTQGLQQQLAQTQQKADLSNLLALMGMAQQKKEEPPPLALVGEITPYEFSTDLLSGVYGPNRMSMANDELLKLARGR